MRDKGVDLLNSSAAIGSTVRMSDLRDRYGLACLGESVASFRVGVAAMPCSWDTQGLRRPGEHRPGTGTPKRGGGTSGRVMETHLHRKEPTSIEVCMGVSWVSADSLSWLP